MAKKKQYTVEVVAPFTRRTKRVKRQGKKVKSVMLRVDADFAEMCRKRAETEGSVTEVTRNLFRLLTGGAA